MRAIRWSGGLTMIGRHIVGTKCDKNEFRVSVHADSSFLSTRRATQQRCSDSPRVGRYQTVAPSNPDRPRAIARAARMRSPHVALPHDDWSQAKTTTCRLSDVAVSGGGPLETPHISAPAPFRRHAFRSVHRSRSRRGRERVTPRGCARRSPVRASACAVVRRGP